MGRQLAEVYREHVTPVWRYVRARVPSDADAEDVTSDVFARAVRSWGRYDPEQAPVGAWLAGIARHTVAEWWRRRGPDVTVEDPGVGASVPDDTEAVVLRLHASDTLRRHLGLLTQKERDAVALRFGADLSSADVAAALGVSETAARMLVYRAVKKLREVIADE